MPLREEKKTTSLKMKNTIEEINNSECEENTEIYLPKDEETSGCSLVETLEKNFAILCLEALQIAKLDSELKIKLRSFNELSNAITLKLQSLMTLSELQFGNKDEIKQFVEQITLNWLRTNTQMVKECAGIHVASRTMSGVSLSTVLEKKKKESAAIKVSLQIGSVIYDQDYVFRGYKTYDDICRVLESMDRCDDKVQQYMAICKTTPYLLDLSSSIDKFIANTELLPMSSDTNRLSENFEAFSFLSQLLTGELLGHESTNPRQILADNAPRRPVFITLNRASSNKRKIDVPKINRDTMLRSSSFPPTVKSK